MAYAALTGSTLPPASGAQGAEWLAVEHSLRDARGSWAGLLFGTSGDQGADIALTATRVARAQGLAPRLVATEAAADRLRQLQSRLQAEGLDPTAARVMGGNATAEPSRAGSAAPLAQHLLAEAPAWDLVRVAVRGLIPPLLNNAGALLNERCAGFSSAPIARGEEALSVRILDAAMAAGGGTPGDPGLAAPAGRSATAPALARPLA